MSKTKVDKKEEVSDSESEIEIDDEEAFENLEKKIQQKHYVHKLDSNEISEQLIMIPTEKRVMSDKMSLAEFTEIIGIRAKDIEKDGQLFIDPGNETRAEQLAENELRAKKCPLMIIRRYPDGKHAERWDANELVLPQ